MKTLVLYDTIGGNTENVAIKINDVVSKHSFNSRLVKLDEKVEIEFYDYDLIFIGSPDVEWLPTQKMMQFLHKEKLFEHRMRGDVLPSAPVRPGRFAVCFATFCGAHNGVGEVLSVTQWLASFCEHIGYTVLDKIHIPGEMRDFGQAKGWINAERLKELNTFGRLGNIIGRPNEQDLFELEERINGLLTYLNFYRTK